MFKNCRTLTQEDERAIQLRLKQWNYKNNRQQEKQHIYKNNLRN